MTPPERVRALNSGPVRTDGEYVLHWMVAARRLAWSHALDHALEHADRLGKPLLIFEPLNVGYRWASDRLHRAILDGMLEHAAALAGTGIGYFPYLEPKPEACRGLLHALAVRACVLVTDDAPVFFTPRLLTAAARIETCRVEAVDGNGILPLARVDRTFVSAHQFRRVLQRVLPEVLGDRPAAKPPGSSRVAPFRGVASEIMERWPPASPEQLGDASTLADLPIDHSVVPNGWRGGHTAARRALDRFIEHGLPRYADERNHPDADVASGLSPWLHFGHVSAHEVFDAVAGAEGWTPLRLSTKTDGSRRGWWGMGDAAEAFLDQLVTWRELGFAFTTRVPDFDRYETLPAWARTTLEDHASDARPHVYTLDQFAAAETHDELWNAAQRQLVRDGTIHNYLRMLWGKKILEWTEHPREALDIMVELNNRYALDGRDPNSYSGIFWTLGRFDRGWPERAIYGKVRSMSSSATRRKVELDEYLGRYRA
ncbi:MAG: deoxyribodipyrimidine photolyase [Gemmatimonadetes bacterium]|nr:deoxyribodipyrimidine photolyase [Gemmatimonadota bacterium]